MFVCMTITYIAECEVANPARGQLSIEINFPCPRTRLRIWSRETGSAAPPRVSLFISILRLNLVLVTYGVPPEFRGPSIYLLKPPYAIGSDKEEHSPHFGTLALNLQNIQYIQHNLLNLY